VKTRFNNAFQTAFDAYASPSKLGGGRITDWTIAQSCEGQLLKIAFGERREVTEGDPFEEEPE